MEGVDLPVEGGDWQPGDRLPGGAGARARRPGKEPAGGAGGVRSGPEGRSPARAGGRRALLRAVGPWGRSPAHAGRRRAVAVRSRGGGSARGRRRAVRGTGHRVLASDGRERLEGEREE